MQWPRGQKIKVTRIQKLSRLQVARAVTSVCCCCRRGSACRYDWLCFLVALWMWSDGESVAEWDGSSQCRRRRSQEACCTTVCSSTSAKGKSCLIYLLLQHRVEQKTSHLSCAVACNLTKWWFFTIRLSNKSVINIPPRFKCVATLPC